MENIHEVDIFFCLFWHLFISFGQYTITVSNKLDNFNQFLLQKYQKREANIGDTLSSILRGEKGLHLQYISRFYQSFSSNSSGKVSKKKKTRPRIDQVKSEVWFRYSLKIVQLDLDYLPNTLEYFFLNHVLPPRPSKS